MTKKQLEEMRSQWIRKNHKYKMVHWLNFDYTILENIMYSRKPGQGDNTSFSDAIIMADTETSKKYIDRQYHNHVCAWTVSIRAFNKNLVTLYGRKPTTFAMCMEKIREHIEGDRIVVYFHNLPYDWVFLEMFLMERFGTPSKQLNIKSHYPLFITFANGLQFRDSLILSQRTLEKWANDLDVEHKKAVGLWDYDKLRSQHEDFSKNELEYIEHDTLAGVECIQKFLDGLHKKIYCAPYTSTGIVREEVRKLGKLNGAREEFERIAPSYKQYIMLTYVFHGGFTHGNRHLINETITGTISCYDFSSSYPFVMLTERMPCEKFTDMKPCKLSKILANKTHAFMFKLILKRPHLKSDFIPMPMLQSSKCKKMINAVIDNGKVLGADYVEIYVNEIDAELINRQYDYDWAICVEVQKAYKKYLPRWFTDYVYYLYGEKCRLKGVDKILYDLAKARLNSMYGLTCQHSIKETINENYQTGEFKEDKSKDPEAEYEKYLNNKNNILPYFWGCWVTSYAMRNLFDLGECVDNKGDTVSHWIYSDTDSIYSDSWDLDKIEAYNERCKEKLRLNGYDAVVCNGREFYPGIAENDDEHTYTEFKVQGAKRYCGRNVETGDLVITVSGVPKKGAEALEDDINNFTKNMIFPGTISGKKEHKYFYVEKPYTDRHGNITGHSIDLSPCDYKLDSVKIEDPNWMDRFLTEELYMQVYEEGRH